MDLVLVGAWKFVNFVVKLLIPCECCRTWKQLVRMNCSAFFLVSEFHTA